MSEDEARKAFSTEKAFIALKDKINAIFNLQEQIIKCDAVLKGDEYFIKEMIKLDKHRKNAKQLLEAEYSPEITMRLFCAATMEGICLIKDLDGMPSPAQIILIHQISNIDGKED